MLIIKTDAESLFNNDVIVDDNDNQSSSLFLGDLSRFTSVSDIEEILSPHLFDYFDVKIMKKNDDGTSHGYGFVEFASVKEANRATTLLQGVSLHGRPLRVNTAGRNIRDVTPLNSPTPTVVNSLHVRFSSKQVYQLFYIIDTTD